MLQTLFPRSMFPVGARQRAGGHPLDTLALSRRAANWLLRCWQAQCRQAERPGRRVPYY